MASSAGGTNNNEYYGFVFSNGTGSFKYDGPYNTPIDPVTGQGTIPAPSSPYPGWTAVGMWHTHPNYTGTATPNGTQNGSHFSPTDLNYINGQGVTGYVGEENSEPGDGFRWYSRQPGATSDSGAQFFGGGGC